MATPPESHAYKGGRRCWPPHLLLTENWPNVDAAQIADKIKRARFLVLRDAVTDYVHGTKSLAQCCDAVRLGKTRFQELVQRCVTRHDDGRIQGFRALVWGAAVKKRRRVKPVKADATGKGGFSGALDQLWVEHPVIREELIDWLLRRGKAAIRGNKTLLHSFHDEFLRLCREDRLTANDYPFCTQNKARRALWKWHKTWFMRHYAARFIVAEHGKDVAGLWNYAVEGDGEAAMTYEPLQAWGMDSFVVDLNTKLRFMSKSLGWYDVPTMRLVGLRLADIVTGTNLAHKLVFEAQVSANDILEVICDAVLGPGVVKKALEGVVLEEGAGYPSELIEELRFAVPLIIYLDNALAHLASEVEFALLGVLGCEIKFGQYRTPRERGAIEAKYRTQALYFLHQMVGTTGSHPTDPVRKFAEADTSKLLDADVLAWAMSAYVQNENCLPNAAAGYLSGLDFLRRALRSGNCRPQKLPPPMRKRYFFCMPIRVRVYMDVKHGQPPEIHFKYATYRSTSLSKRTDLWKRWMTVRYDVRSLRTIMLFHDDGKEFGPIQATGKWARFPHSMWFRLLYGRLKNKKLLGRRPETRPLLAVYDYLRDQAGRDRRAALQLAALNEMLLAAGGSELASVDESTVIEFAEWEAIEESAQAIRVAPIAVPLAKTETNESRPSVSRKAAAGGAPGATTPSLPLVPPNWGANKPPRAGLWKPVRR